MAPIKNPEIKYCQLFINNEWHDSGSGGYAVINPATGKYIMGAEEADEIDVDKAVAAARNAFKRGSTWRTIDASDRGCLLLKLANLIRRDIEYITSLEVVCSGKPYSEAILDIKGTIAAFEYYGSCANNLQGKTIPADGNTFSFTRLEPIGVCGQIIPWNYPMLMLSWKLGPALATGNVVILNPAEQTPFTALYCASLIKEAGFPPGVVNILPGKASRVGADIAAHPKIDKVVFAGSAETGKEILEAAGASNAKKVTLEIGGISPLVIFNDVDVDKAAEIAYTSIFGNKKQCCCAGTRTYVQEGIYEEFINKSIEHVQMRVISDPFCEFTNHAPQINEEELNKILELINSGVKEGAKINYGGRRYGKKGYYIVPTIISDVKEHMRIAKEEIFGPVQQILKFSTLDEVVERANDAYYGLGSGVITNDLNTALTFAQAIQAGSVWVNCYDATMSLTPFGGFKMPGQGRQLSEDSLYEYLKVKTVTVAIPEKNS